MVRFTYDVLKRGKILGQLVHDVLTFERVLAQIRGRQAVHDRAAVVEIELWLEEGDRKRGCERSQALANQRTMTLQLALDPLAFD